MLEDAIRIIKESGCRITFARKNILALIFASNVPISAVDILEALKKRKQNVNKTTVYREINFLTKVGFVRPLYLISGIVHYESNLLPHHHHLICKKCKKIEGVGCFLDEEKVYKKIKKSGFKLDNHTLEFHGVCRTCARN